MADQADPRAAKKAAAALVTAKKAVGPATAAVKRAQAKLDSNEDPEKTARLEGALAEKKAELEAANAKVKELTPPAEAKEEEEDEQEGEDAGAGAAGADTLPEDLPVELQDGSTPALGQIGAPSDGDNQTRAQLGIDTAAAQSAAAAAAMEVDRLAREAALKQDAALENRNAAAAAAQSAANTSGRNAAAAAEAKLAKEVAAQISSLGDACEAAIKLLNRAKPADAMTAALVFSKSKANNSADVNSAKQNKTAALRASASAKSGLESLKSRTAGGNNSAGWRRGAKDFCKSSLASLESAEETLEAKEEAAKKDNVSKLAARHAEVEAARQGVPAGARYEDYLEASTVLSAAIKIAKQAVTYDEAHNPIRNAEKDAAVVEAQSKFQQVKDKMTVYYQERARKGLYDIAADGSNLWDVQPGQVQGAKFQCGPYVFEVGQDLIPDPEGVYKFPEVIYEAQVSLQEISHGHQQQLSGLDMSKPDQLPCPSDLAAGGGGAAAIAAWGPKTAEEKQSVWTTIGLGFANLALKVTERVADKLVDRFLDGPKTPAEAVAAVNDATKQASGRYANKPKEWHDKKAAIAAQVTAGTLSAKEAPIELRKWSLAQKGSTGKTPAEVRHQVRFNAAEESIAAGVKHNRVLKERAAAKAAAKASKAAAKASKAAAAPRAAAAAPALAKSPLAPSPGENPKGGRATRRKQRRSSYKRPNMRKNATRQRQGRKSRRRN